MAERRMFAKKIIDSARFIKMPLETQSFYFHLGVRADDDGIVEAFSVMRLLGVSEDSLKILVAKGFVTVLNDDLVSHITDWKEHNLIRADRKVDSIYKNLLLQLLPDIDLIEKRDRADRKHDQNKWDVPRTTTGQHSIGEYSIVEDSKEYIADALISSNTEKKPINKDALLISEFKELDGASSELTLTIAQRFIDYRKKIKKPIKTAKGIKLYIDSLRECIRAGYDLNEVVELSEAKEWQSIKLEWVKKELTLLKEGEWK